MTGMRPDAAYVTIGDNVAKIKDFLLEVILIPRLRMINWSRITNQTPNLKIGYPGQHLASLITGIKGTATGARGEDIADGTEVKSCSRVDQVDKCNDCGNNVMRSQPTCPNCGSASITRNNDSKWLIAIRNEKELNLYLKQIPRTFFLLSDYPNFDASDFSTLRFSSYEIWNQSDRARNFRKLLQEYYSKIYLTHIKRDATKTPAPKNFWPYSYQFYLCNPIKTFECIVHNADTKPEIEITTFVDPKADRSKLESEELPLGLLKKRELGIVKQQGFDVSTMTSLNETLKNLLPLRETSEAKPQKRTYHRM